MLYLTFFFFKQKTAYDMRISDWNSAVCSSDLDAGASRGRAFANALAPADFTGKWTGLAAPDRRLTAVTAAELATPAEEAQAIALALRAALEEPGKTAALVTPDRAQIGRASCRERVCQYVWLSVVAVS